MRYAATIIVAAMLVACGGGGEDPPEQMTIAKAGVAPAAWDPARRYRSGELVLRLGKTYEATELSNTTWNVNTPPEWSANYWRDVTAVAPPVVTPPPVTPPPVTPPPVTPPPVTPPPVTPPPATPTTYPEWEQLTRYMPGDRVLRRGKVFEATALSATLWNVWSYPEWTPNLWTDLGVPAPSAGIDWGLVPLVDSPNELLETGRSVTYWAESNEWNLAVGDRSNWVRNVDYTHKIGVSPKTGPNGEVAFAMAWNFPLTNRRDDVLTAPGLVSGFKPGSKTGNNCVRWNYCVRELDGTIDMRVPQNGTLGSPFPLTVQAGIDRGLKVHHNHKYLGNRTGRAHVAWELWLQQYPGQDFGFMRASTTHEILVPISNTGLYGDHSQRYRGWHDHDVTIDGRLFHVYLMGKNGGRNPLTGWEDWSGPGPGGSYPGLNYTWGALDPNGPASGPDAPGSYGRVGWKFIVMQPAVLPIQGEINFGKILNHLLTRKDEAGQPLLSANLHVVSAELFAEPVSGESHVQAEDVRVWTEKP